MSATTLAIVVIFIPVAFMKRYYWSILFPVWAYCSFCSDFHGLSPYSYPYDVIDFSQTARAA